MDVAAGLPASLPWMLGAAAGLTLLLFFESTRSPWAPFFIFHAISSIMVPVLAGVWPRGNPFSVIAQEWRATLMLLVLLCLWEHLIWGRLFEGVILKRFGKQRDPYWSPAMALERVLDQSTAKLGISRTAAQSLFAAYALLWAPFGEELFFWGFLHAGMGGSAGFWPATLSVSALFAFHHILYLGGMPYRKPWGSLAAFALTSFGTGILLSLAFRSTQSLYPLMAAHFGANLVWVASASLEK